jgi:hypothetical protein
MPQVVGAPAERRPTLGRGEGCSRTEPQRASTLLQARKGGEVMLAEIGLSTLDVPEGQVTPAVVPPSVASASAEELAERPNVLSFLPNNAARRGDLDATVSFSERAVGSAGDQASALRMELARFIHRRTVSGDMSPAAGRKAIQHAHAVIEERRRWDGPSAEALAFVLDTQIPGDMAAAVTAALPASEAAQPAIPSQARLTSRSGVPSRPC